MSVQVPKGYKQTEVGVIPEDWELSALEKLTDPNRPISYGIVQTGPNVLNGIKCLRVVDIDNGKIKKENLITTTKEISDSYKRTILKNGDLVIPLRGKVGEVGLIEGDLEGSNLTRGVGLIALRKDFDSLFFKQNIASIESRRRLEQSMNGSALQEIPIATLRAFKIAYPKEIVEQQAIAESLSDADALIESLEQLIAKKRQIKQGAMQELLTGQRRLPGFSGEWIQQRLGDIAHIKTGGRNNQDKVENGEFPFFVRSATVERINTFTYDCEAILVPGEGGIGSIFHYIFGKFDVHQRVYAITQFAGNVSGKFIYYYMKTYFGRHAMENSVKATVDSLRLPTFQDFVVKTPSCVEEQIEITSILSEMEQELEMLEERLQKARTIKQSMMQELLTGRIRLI